MLSAPPEMTTAITDGLLGILALALAWRLGKNRDLRTRLWTYVLAGTGVVAILGVPAHALYSIAGTNPPDLEAQTLYWIFLGLFLFIMITVIAVAVLHDVLGERYLRISIVVAALCGFFLYILYAIVAVMQLIEGYFVIFAGYSAMVMLFALVAYCVLYVKRKKNTYLVLAVAILTAIVASILQASRAVSFTLIWEFDYNSIYHFVMMGSVLLFYRAVRESA